MQSQSERKLSEFPLRPLRLANNEIVVETKSDGTIYLRHPQPLAPYPDRMTDRLLHWAARTPDAVFIAQRDKGADWRKITYSQALAMARSIGEALLRRGLSAERPLVILSKNDLEHAMLSLGALYAGVAYAPISPAYATVATDFGKLKHVIDLLTPGMVFAADGRQFSRAFDAVARPDMAIVVTAHPPEGRAVSLFDELIATTPTDLVETAHDAVGPDTVAKFVFTSGSTSLPKAVINTQRMLCANQVMIRDYMIFVQDEPPVLLDWLPWNHTFGGNHNFYLVLFNGGAFYIDEGNPSPRGIAETIRNLKEVSPTIYFNVPKGFEALLPHLRADQAAREGYFRNLKMNYFAGAGMTPVVWDAFDQLAIETRGERIAMLTGLGSTETAPFAICCNLEHSKAGNVGVPVPGLDLKLAPVDGKLEGRVKGPNVTPGYWRQPALTDTAFDEEGYYNFGDALVFVDPDAPHKGMRFDGRIAEDFKLGSGTWVSVGPLRAAFLNHFAPYAKDVAIAGLNEDFVAGLVFPDYDECARLAGCLPDDASPAAVVDHPRVRALFLARLKSFAQSSTGSASRVERITLLETPPSLALGEITDKGSINQKLVLKVRSADVAGLFSAVPSARVIDVSQA